MAVLVRGLGLSMGIILAFEALFVQDMVRVLNLGVS